MYAATSLALATGARVLGPPTTQSGLPPMSRPLPPQCWLRSPRRTTGRPLTSTVAAPSIASHAFSPQHVTSCLPRSHRRTTGLPFTVTLGEPVVAGPSTVCGHAGHWWASLGFLP
ncbi:MAG: hypothetical protein QM820_44580 [Minicystis sp.]